MISAGLVAESNSGSSCGAEGVGDEGQSRSGRASGQEMLSFDMKNSKELCTSTQVWICIVCGNGGRWRQMVGYGGRASQTQSLKLNLCPLFVCIVFESIQPLCAQYLRNISRDKLSFNSQPSEEYLNFLHCLQVTILLGDVYAFSIGSDCLLILAEFF